jgi:hypothetical protein
LFTPKRDGIIAAFVIASGVNGANLSPGASRRCTNANGSIPPNGLRAPEKEREALLALHREQNYPEKDAQQLVEIISREPGRWVGTMRIVGVLAAAVAYSVGALLKTFGNL